MPPHRPRLPGMARSTTTGVSAQDDRRLGGRRDRRAPPASRAASGRAPPGRGVSSCEPERRRQADQGEQLRAARGCRASRKARVMRASEADLGAPDEVGRERRQRTAQTVKRTPPPSVRSAILRSRPDRGAGAQADTGAEKLGGASRAGRAGSPVAVPMSAARRTITTTCQKGGRPFATSEPDLFAVSSVPGSRVALLVLLDVLPGAAELLGDQRRAEHAVRILTSARPGTMRPRSMKFGGCGRAAEVDVNPFRHGIVDARAEGISWVDSPSSGSLRGAMRCGDGAGVILEGGNPKVKGRARSPRR